MVILATRVSRRILTAIACVCLGLVLTLQLPGWTQVDSGLQLALQGQKLYNAGQLEQAADKWQQAAAAYQAQGDRHGFFNSSIAQSQALQDLGLAPIACKVLLSAWEVENPSCNPEQLDELIADLLPQIDTFERQQAIGLRSLGNVLYRQGILEPAEKILQLSLRITQDEPESAATLVSLGNVVKAQGDRLRDNWDYNEVTEIIDSQSVLVALKPYLAVFDNYERAAAIAPNSLIKVQAQLNHFSLALDLQDWWQEQTQRRIASRSRYNQTDLIQRAKGFLRKLNSPVNLPINRLQTEIKANITKLPTSGKGVAAQINFAHSLLRRQPTPEIEALLNRALQTANSLGDKRGETYALGYLGQYYGQQGKTQQAIALTRQALILAQDQNINGDAREISYLWQSQLGKLNRQIGNDSQAIAAYTAAYNTIQSLRNDLNTNNPNVQFNFRQEVRPVYLELTDLLLRSNLSPQKLKSLKVNRSNFSQNQGTTTSPNNLELARRVIESLQLAELDNFFQDPCSEVSKVAVQIDDIDPQAAVIYPIVLPDSLQVILSLPGKPLQNFTTWIDQEQVDRTLDQLYDSLYNQSVDNSAVNIFRTIPLNAKEVEENLQELLPIFQQIYSWLIAPVTDDLIAQNIQTLVFVLNGRLQQVPMAALYDSQQYLLEKYSIALTPSLQLTDARPLARQELKVLAAGLSQEVTARGEIFPALENVPQELKQIKSVFPNAQILLDREFTTAKLQEQLQADFPVIHLATHGLFSSDPEDTFIVTGNRQKPNADSEANNSDNTINLQELSQAIAADKINQPELIVLSACETATGDERAILGLAGVAVRSGTRSTLATLWAVEDASTAQVMGQFYRQFKQPNFKKVTALQQAQLSLLQSLKDNPPLEELANLPPHPYYWSPYVLVGNWQ